MAEFTFKWLLWDGSYTLNGQSNHVKRSDSNPDSGKRLLLPTLNIPRGQSAKQPPSIVSATAISVRLIEIVESPENYMAIKVQLKRLKKIDGSWNIKSLMLRIYQNYDATKDTTLPKEKLVYQEIIRKEQIDQLANAQNQKEKGDTSFPKEKNLLLSGTDGALITNKGSNLPYKVRVWVSTKKNAFGKEGEDLLPFIGEPPSVYTMQVHDQYKPSEAELSEKFNVSGGGVAWGDFIKKRQDKEKGGKFDDISGKNLTGLSYQTFMVPAAEISIVQATLEESARLGVPFTEGLIEVAKAVSSRS